MSQQPSQFVWYELLTSDPDAAASFYGAVVGWTVQPSGMPGMDYRMLQMGQTMVGGLMAIPAEAAAGGMRPAWLAYVTVPDVDEALEAITATGGGVRVPPTDIPGVGRFAMITDPQGAAIYIMTPMAEGASEAFAPGRPGHGGWNELSTTDWEAAWSFYSEHFGWTKDRAMDMGPMGTYQLFNTGGEAVGAMMNNARVPHPFWLYYFCVEDINAAKARVLEAGGAVHNGPMEVPGPLWIIQAQDPQGAMFALVAPK